MEWATVQCLLEAIAILQVCQGDRGECRASLRFCSCRRPMIIVIYNDELVVDDVVVIVAVGMAAFVHGRRQCRGVILVRGIIALPLRIGSRGVVGLARRIEFILSDSVSHHSSPTFDSLWCWLPDDGSGVGLQKKKKRIRCWAENVRKSETKTIN